MSHSSSALAIEQVPEERVSYTWHDGVEHLETYQAGGYHPVHLQEVYKDDRYCVVHKLGYGSFSTVWLARDQHKNQYVALKILIAERSQAASESRILRYLQDVQQKCGTRSYVIPLLDEFYIDGPNGRHLCLVNEIARCSIRDSNPSSNKWNFPLVVARAIAAQAVLGLKEIHSSGVVHGDLHPGNLLLRLPPINSLSIEELYRRYGGPYMTKVEREDGKPCGPEVPEYSVMPAALLLSNDEVCDPSIVISDFGEAWFSDTQTREDLHTPVIYLPPEVTFSKKTIGKPADVWTLACTIYEILGERTLFESFMADRDAIIAEMVSTLGMLPRQWWESWQARAEFFLEDGSWRTNMTRCHDATSRPLFQRIQENGRKDDAQFTMDEATSLEKMLRSMLTYNPSERPTVSDIMESDWMKRWGVPSLEKFSERLQI